MYPMGTAAIYVRISQDREGAGLGVARQEQDCRALCDRKGWTVGEVYVDDDVSAYSGKPRPAWRRLLADIEAGSVDALSVWHVDRLTRTPRELEDVIGYAEKHGLELATVTGDVDLATPTGRMVARMLGAAARHESEHKAERQRRERRQSAERGRVAGGGHRPFGYAGDRVTVVDIEADVIRECARRVLQGESLSSLCRDLASRGVTTTAGNGWTPTTLRALLASARISGRREHRARDSYRGARPLLGEIVADAVWPGIISAEDNDRLRVLLSNPDRQRFNSATGRKYLLSGIARCAHCGEGMIGRPKAGQPRYVCSNLPGGRSCGRMATVAAPLDETVRDAVLLALSEPGALARMQQRDDIDPAVVESVHRDEAKLEDLAGAWASDEITRSEWTTARGVIESRLKRNRATLSRATRTEPLAALATGTGDLRDRWDALPIGQQRAIIAALLERVIVRPADRSRRYDPDRFDLIWRV
jgi:site-specific DNA recombinase